MPPNCTTDGSLDSPRIGSEFSLPPRTISWRRSGWNWMDTLSVGRNWTRISRFRASSLAGFSCPRSRW